jgi:sugar lactone lactonase YvrE
MTFFMKEQLIGHQAGRVISYNLKTGEAKVLLDKIAFTNGIVFEKKTNSIIFVELNRFTIWRYRITEQTKEVLIDNLFGYPDNLKLN